MIVHNHEVEDSSPSLVTLIIYKIASCKQRLFCFGAGFTSQITDVLLGGFCEMDFTGFIYFYCWYPYSFTDSSANSTAASNRRNPASVIKFDVPVIFSSSRKKPIRIPAASVPSNSSAPFS